MPTVGSLFAGIGGFDLGFERAGFQIKWQIEIDPFCRAVLAKHWPDVRRYEDVRTVHGDELAAVDVLCGGFPCQPHSLAGARGGASDERDLWPEFIRLIRELGPRWVVAENVPGLLSSDAGRFFGTVLGDLAACGYDAEWDCLPASAFGAHHRRDRVWIVATGNRQQAGHEATDAAGRGGSVVGHADAGFRRTSGASQTEGASAGFSLGTGASMADAESGDGQRWTSRIFGHATFSDQSGASEQWRVEPDVGRVAHGVSARVDRLRGLGNSIVPQIAQWIAERIKEAESATERDTERSGAGRTTNAVDPIGGSDHGLTPRDKASS